jgi:hypothetical protein
MGNVRKIGLWQRDYQLEIVAEQSEAYKSLLTNEVRIIRDCCEQSELTISYALYKLLSTGQSLVPWSEAIWGWHGGNDV